MNESGRQKGESTRGMLFLSGGKRYRGESATEIVREMEREAADYPCRGQSIRRFLLWSLGQLRDTLHPRELDVSDRLHEEELALNYLYLCDEYNLGVLLDAREMRKLMKVVEAAMAGEATIYITEVDRQRLLKLIEIVGERDDVAGRENLRRLEQEVDRAETVASRDVPADVITMRSKVRLRDLDTGEGMVYSLVFPTEAKYDEGRISVLAPVGTAMLGYRVGATIEWQVPSGLRRLKVEELLYQPEAAGDYNL